MGISIVSGPTVRQNSPALAQSFSISTTGSGQRMCVLVIASYATTSGTSSITDNAGNTWSKVTNSSHASLQQRVEIWYTITSSSITSITVNEAASHAVSVIFYEIAGFDTTTPIRASASGNDTTSDTTWAMGTYNRTAGGEILLIHGSSSPNITLTTVAPPFNYTTGGIAGGGATTQAGNSVHRIHTTATGTYGGNETTNLSSTNGWAYVVINGAKDITASMPTASASSDTSVDAGSTGTGGAAASPPVATSTEDVFTISGTGGATVVVPQGGAYTANSFSGVSATGGATGTPPVSPSLFAAIVATYITEAIVTAASNADGAGWASIPIGTGGATAVVGVASASGGAYIPSASLDLYVQFPFFSAVSASAIVPTRTTGATKAVPIATGTTSAASPLSIITVPIGTTAQASASALAISIGIGVSLEVASASFMAESGFLAYQWYTSELGMIIRTRVPMPVDIAREPEPKSPSVSRANRQSPVSVSRNME